MAPAARRLLQIQTKLTADSGSARTGRRSLPFAAGLYIDAGTGAGSTVPALKNDMGKPRLKRIRFECTLCHPPLVKISPGHAFFLFRTSAAKQPFWRFSSIRSAQVCFRARRKSHSGSYIEALGSNAMRNGFLSQPPLRALYFTPA